MNGLMVASLILLGVVFWLVIRIGEGRRADREKRESQIARDKELAALFDGKAPSTDAEARAFYMHYAMLGMSDEEMGKLWARQHAARKSGDDTAYLREPHERIAVEIVGQDVYDEKIRRATAGLYGGRRSSRYYGDSYSYGGFDLSDYASADGGDWDREAAILAAQQNLRIMREEDLNYAMADIESQILNMDHIPTEDELIGIADSAADYYDMSEDYQDY